MIQRQAFPNQIDLFPSYPVSNSGSSYLARVGPTIRWRYVRCASLGSKVAMMPLRNDYAITIERRQLAELPVLKWAWIRQQPAASSITRHLSRSQRNKVNDQLPFTRRD
jgi:hypothetical protein